MHKMIEVIVGFLCLVPLIIFLCDMQSLQGTLQKWLLKAYSFYTNYQVKKAQDAKELSHYKTVYLNDEKGRPYVIIDREKFFLVAMKAQPLKGPLIGENFYTSNKANAIIEVVDSKF